MIPIWSKKYGCWVCKLDNTKLKFNYDKNLDIKNSKIFKSKIRNNYNLDLQTLPKNCNKTKMLKTTKK